MYFPDYCESEVPERDFFFGVLGGIRGNELKSILDEALAWRQANAEEEDKNLIEINEEYFDALSKLPIYKSKQFSSNNQSYSH